MAAEKQTRLNKYLSETGYCSRRKADRLIEEGRVTINGKTPEMGTKVATGDVVEVDGEVISPKKKENVYLAFNKPIGIVCTTNPADKDNIIDYINYPSRIFPIGRLDKPSEGLILLTDDGDIVNKILRSRNNHGKEYIVKVDRPVNDDFIERMSSGVPILDTITKKCEVEQLGKFTFRIVLTQGLNRQIRRMCEYLGYEVVKLKRVRVLNIELDVPVGQYRHLSPEELQELEKLTSESSKTYEEEGQSSPGIPPEGSGQPDLRSRRNERNKKSPRKDGQGKRSTREPGQKYSDSRRKELRERKGRKNNDGKPSTNGRKP